MTDNEDTRSTPASLVGTKTLGSVDDMNDHILSYTGIVDVCITSKSIQ